MQPFVLAGLVFVGDAPELFSFWHVPTGNDVPIDLEQRQGLSAWPFVSNWLREEAHPHFSRIPAVGGSWVVVCLHTIP